jgi:hypothetical protein
MKLLSACCNHPEHARPWRNEDGWVLTGDPKDSATWEAWMANEWSMHCSNYRNGNLRRESVDVLEEGAA